MKSGPMVLFLMVAILLQAGPVYLPLIVVSREPASPGVLQIEVLQCETANEYVRIDNTGGSAVAMSEWSILSVVGPQTFFFPEYQLEPGTSVYVHSGPDAPASGGYRLRWTTSYIWNNNNDEARLISPAGVVVSSRSC